MTEGMQIDFSAIRSAMANFNLSSKVEPNEFIEPDRAFFPDGHRGVLDLKRQLVVGNRGMGKSFWTHALLNAKIRDRLASVYSLPALARTEVVIGFNGSEKLGEVAPTIEEISTAMSNGYDAELIWRAVLLRATRSMLTNQLPMEVAPAFRVTIDELISNPHIFAQNMTAVDNMLLNSRKSLLIIFDALDRLTDDWTGIRHLTKSLLVRILGLQSFRAIRAKVFMRVDQFADEELFVFPDSSKIKIDRVDLSWRPHELYGLLFFELLRDPDAHRELDTLADLTSSSLALPTDGRLNSGMIDQQALLVRAIAGEFMGHRKSGRVYTWVPLHLSDAANSCSPRTFLIAWKSAAEHFPPPTDRVVDHLGLKNGVRSASSARLTELREDYPWIDAALEPLHRQFVPIARHELFAVWEDGQVVTKILENSERNKWLAPIDVFVEHGPDALLQTMSSVGVMEKRANGKINVPDIFRVEAGILRRGGVAVPRRA